ncbi:MAG TPA: PRC-barrel domain-containing protein [Stellaceae bacterium]|nr:PRC-barrel domain-containing protein [Stellaceae bacterium]
MVDKIMENETVPGRTVEEKVVDPKVQPSRTGTHNITPPPATPGEHMGLGAPGGPTESRVVEREVVPERRVEGAYVRREGEYVRPEGELVDNNPEPGTNIDETARLIASDKVEGTNVRRSNGDKLGVIRRLMVDKFSGKVAYAVMSFGGFLGIGDEYRAIPWSMLEYNERLDAYELNVTDEQLRGAPPPERGWDRWDTDRVDRRWERDLHDYYHTRPYW